MIYFLEICTSADSLLHNNKLQDYFSTSELVEYQTRKTKLQKIEWLTSRFALKKAYRYYKNRKIPFSEIHVKKNTFCIPYIANEPELFCSISHSNILGGAVVSEHPVGIDLEMIRHHTKDLTYYIADKSEVKQIQNIYKYEYVTALWTMKESVLKALGVGLQLSPQHIQIYKQLEDSLFLALAKHNNTTWKVNVYNKQNYIVSIAEHYEHKAVYFRDSTSVIQTA